MHPIDQLIRINTILYHYKECDKTFKESEHIRPQLLQSFDLVKSLKNSLKMYLKTPWKLLEKGMSLIVGTMDEQLIWVVQSSCFIHFK